MLAAGTFGTTYLLLRNRTAFPGLSGALGTRFSGNGDLLGFLMDAASGRLGRDPRAPNTGPVITSAIRVGDDVGRRRCRRTRPLHRGRRLPRLRRLARRDRPGPGHGLGALAVRAAAWPSRTCATPATRRIGGDLADLLGAGSLTATSLPLLGMGRDVPDGVDAPARRPPRASTGRPRRRSDYFERRRARPCARSPASSAATYADNPLWWAKRVITVHPLGGAPMGRHAGEGVCDEYGEVFGHPGLYVMDGALLPGPVGANPSLTIAAVADRGCTHILEGRRRPRADDGGLRTRRDAADLVGSPTALAPSSTS